MFVVRYAAISGPVRCWLAIANTRSRLLTRTSWLSASRMIRSSLVSATQPARSASRIQRASETCSSSPPGYTSAIVCTTRPRLRSASGTIRRPRLRSTKNSGGGEDLGGTSGPHVLERDAEILSHGALALARLDPASHVDQPGCAVDEDRLPKGPLRIRHQQRLLRDRQRSPAPPTRRRIRCAAGSGRSHRGTPADRSAPRSAAPAACHPASGRNRRAAPRHPYEGAATPTRARGQPPRRGAPTPGGSAATEAPSLETPPRPSPLPAR